MPQDNADTLPAVPDRRHRRRLGARAVGHPPGRRRAAAGPRRRGDLWPDGKFVTTAPRRAHRRSSTQHPDVVKALLSGHVGRRSTSINDEPGRGPGSSSTTGIETITGASRSATAVVDAPGRTSTFTARPDRLVARRTSADDADRPSGCSIRSTSTGIYDLTLLNKVLRRAQGKPDGGSDRDRARRVAPATRRTRRASAKRSARIRGVTRCSGRPAATSSPSTDVALDVARGEFVCLVGASGCGKSTLLNLVAGLDKPTAGTVDVDGRVGADVPGGGAVPVAHRGAATSSWRCGSRACRAGRAPGARRRAARARPPRRLRRQAAARALGRHAPARRAGPGARPGRRRAADGRAVRRARRHDPRPAPRRARRALARARPHRRLRDPQRARGRAARRPRRAAAAAARAGWRPRRSIDIAAPPAHRLDPRSQRSPPAITDRLREEVLPHARRRLRSSAIAAARARRRSTHLELPTSPVARAACDGSGAARGRKLARRRPRRSLRLAGVVWSGWKPDYVLPGPPRSVLERSSSDSPATTGFVAAIATTLRRAASSASRWPSSSAAVIGIAVRRVEAPARRGRRR